MKRRLSMLALFLLLGAIVNVAVAWVLVSLTPNLLLPYHVQEEASEEDKSRLPNAVAVDPESSSSPATFAVDRFPGVRHVSMIGTAESKPAYEIRAGLPLASVTGVRRMTVDLRQTDATRAVFKVPGTSSTYVPYAPIWPGFAINTAFYAMLLWLPFVLRRWQRIKRGLCPKCAYPVGTSEICTECGAAVTKQNAETHKA